MRIPMVRGRTFTDADDDKAKYVAIVNETMAKRFWPNQDPVGRLFTMARDPNYPMEVVVCTKNLKTTDSPDDLSGTATVDEQACRTGTVLR